MKAIKIRPYQRQLLVVLSLTILTGCSGFQPNAVYKNLEQSVQHVYKAAAPIHKEGLVPALFKTVPMPGMDFLKRPMIMRANYRPWSKAPVKKAKPKPPMLNKSNTTSAKDLNYIEQHYGL